MKIPNWKRVTHALLSPAGKANEVKYLVDLLPPGADNQTVFAAVGQARKKGVKIEISQKMGVWYYIREINAQEARALCPLPGVHTHTTPPPAASETKRCLHLIKAKAPASVSSVDVADFFDISDADANALLFSLSRSRPDILKISIHVKIK